MQLTCTLHKMATPVLLLLFIKLEVGVLACKIAGIFAYNRPVSILLDEIKISDSALAKKATALVESCSPWFLVNHSIRTYCFGVAIAKHLRIKADPEGFYLSAIINAYPRYDFKASFACLIEQEIGAPGWNRTST